MFHKAFAGKVYIFLPILTLVFGLICTTQGVNLFIAFAPIMVMMAFAMGLDSLTGASIILLGGAIGFAIGHADCKHHHQPVSLFRQHLYDCSK